jgi:steroid delta-isomerase
MMPSHEQMVAAVHAYVDAFSRHDTEAVVELYAPEATVEDPVGTPLHHGIEAIRAFYTRSIQTGATLTLAGPVRTAANMAAFAFSANVPSVQGPARIIDVIDTFRFDSNGKVVAMRAFWSPANVHETVG